MTERPSSAPGPAPRGVRRELALGDGLTRYPPGAPFALRLDSKLEWEGWRARVEGDAVRATFPGTPVRFEGDWYEVVRAEPLAGRFAYYLAPWDESFPLREPRELSEEACRAEHARAGERARRDRASTLLVLASPFVGLLPAEDQERIEREHGLPAVRTTVVSALALGLVAMLVFGVGLLMWRMSGLAARSPELAWTATALPFAGLGLVDSAVRLMLALGGSAAGSGPVVGVLAAWRALRAKRGLPSFSRRLPPGAFDGVRDEVRALPATRDEEAGYEIVSRLPKPHWTLNVTPIRYADTVWSALEREESQVGGETRHRFVLRPYGDEVLRVPPVDYAPDEVGRLHRESVRADRQMWIGMFGVFWGLLDPPRQEALAAVFDYDPPRQTMLSTTMGLALGGLAAVLAFVYIVTSGGGKTVDWIMLLAGGALFAESLVRRRRLERGAATGSVLGVPLRWTARRLAEGLDRRPETVAAAAASQGWRAGRHERQVGTR